VSELMRGSLIPSVPHIAPWICVLALFGANTLLLTVGLRGFYRRAID
jgi:ABC-2 type transport system permease protein